MKILLNNSDLNEALNGVSKIGFVPTMGSIHEGHKSLIRKSKNDCKKTLVSIFINPTQFNSKNDFLNYPKNFKKDLRVLKNLRVNYVFMPKYKHVYNFKRKSKIKLRKKDKILCAKFRRGHFEGVIDVMDRLTKLINPQKIFMGEKDFQQLHLLKRYITNKYKSKIVSCKTIRNKAKVALSSRNNLLNKKQLVLAGKLAQSLFIFKKRLNKKKDFKKIFNDKKKELNKLFNIKIEYLELRNIFDLSISTDVKNSKLFIAYYLNKIRLIDNF